MKKLLHILKSLLDYVLDTLAFFTAVFFQAPTERFDRLIGKYNGNSEPFEGHHAEVIEIVTHKTGMVRYAGVNQQAVLAEGDKTDSIESGTRVSVKGMEQGKLVVELE